VLGGRDLAAGAARPWTCHDAAGATVSCVGSGDDGQYGRDPAFAAGQFAKTGAGAAGFDFTKIANNGTTLASGTALGANPTDWACTRDNVTGLMWEVKTTSGLRSNANAYTWYSTDSATNGGNAGGLGTDTCGGTLSAYSNQCNTTNFAAAVNAVTLCGHSDWRMPTRRELRTLVFYAGAGTPSIDATYFPNTNASSFWSGSSYIQDPANAWLVFFGTNSVFDAASKAVTFYVRLVRGGQF
jgi:hypothetical protein